MKVTLVRHLAPDVEPGRCYGRLDLPLHPAALEILPTFAARPDFHGALRIWSSPALRCRTLAEAMAEMLDAPLRIDPRLAELDFGEWEGQEWANLDRADFDRWAASPAASAPPGGESGEALIARVSAICWELLSARETCVVVTHAGPLKIMSALLRGAAVDLFARSPPFGAVLTFDCASLQAGST